MIYKVLDIENLGEPWSGKLLCVGWDDKAYVEPLPDFVLSELADPDIAKVVMTKHDHRWLRLYGIDVQGPVVDVQTMAWVVDERQDLDLESLTKRYVPHTVKTKRIFSRARQPWFVCDDGTECPLEQAPLEQVREYNEQDLESTRELFYELRRRIASQGLQDYYLNDCLPFTSTLVDMECRGLPVDVAGAEEFALKLENEIATLEAVLLHEAGVPAGFNLGSNDQLASLLYTRSFQFPERIEITKEQRAALKQQDVPRLNGLVVEKLGVKYATVVHDVQGFGLEVKDWTLSRKPSTDAKTLAIHYGTLPWVQRYLDMAKRKTVLNTFLKAIAERSHNGRLYGRFNQTGTKTGRLSSSGPNLQNIPARGELGKGIRQLFRPEPGYAFLHGDYSQLEPRLMAHWSQDPVLLEVYNEGKDVYVESAVRMFHCSEQEARAKYRDPLKVFFLALGYGSSAKTLRKQLALFGHPMPLYEVEENLAALKQVYRVLFDWKEEVIAQAGSDGYVETLSGHRRRFNSQGNKPKTWREQAANERQAVNAVIQGSAADVVGRAMMLTSSIAGVELLVQVHDEMLWQYKLDGSVHEPSALAAIKSYCTVGHGFDLTVPLEFEPRRIYNWAQGKD